MKYEHLIERIKGSAMSIREELEALGAPRAVLEAGDGIQKSLDAKMRPSWALVTYVERWVGRQREQNRWGK